MAEDEDRRRQEINMFAALALGGDEPMSESFAQPSPAGSDSSAVSPRKDAFDSGSVVVKPQQNVFNVFGEGAQVDSGTFQLASAAVNKNALAEKSNLEAAAAALSDGEPQPAPMPLTNPLLQANVPVHPPAEEDAPMFSEKVTMSRPLFFGAILPPRVLEEGRNMVRDAMRDLGLDPDVDPVPSLRQLPEGVRNLVGAIRVHGFSLDDLLFSNGDRDGEYWRGDARVSTYQPVWGESIRLARIKEFRKRNRPRHVTRVSTAPPRLGDSMASSLSSGITSLTSSTTTAATPSNSITSTSEKWMRQSHAGESSTPSGQSTGEPANPRVSANEQFSAWLRSDDDSLGKGSAGSVGSVKSLDELPTHTDSMEEAEEVHPPPLSEQQLFSQWAQGSESVRTLRDSTENVWAGTFQRVPTLPVHSGDSDDDSLKHDELKKQVGLSDHLSKAIASLGDDGRPPTDIITIEESKLLLAQTPADDSKARPLTNYELTNGCVPLFGVDDAPLPVEGDLGVHETKEEQQRSNEQKRSQEIIEKFVGPNVFGSIACPNPALNPDDFHSWNSRSVAAQQRAPNPSSSDQLSVTTSSKRSQQVGTIDSSNPGSIAGTSRAPEQKTRSKKSKLSHSRSRYGWWNVKEGDPLKESVGRNLKGQVDSSVTAAKTTDDKTPLEQKMEPGGQSLQIPPLHHSSSTMQVATLLEPTPDELCKANLPLSRMHAATSMAQTLPYISDRPPSYRYLQMDTQTVGFRPIGADIEPLFCSLAIYNVETVSSGGGDHGAAPVPDLQRCGRVTEALNFDILSDTEIAERCSDALWPYAKSSGMADDLVLEGTRCGLFPVPSNLSVSNLYAVLIVRKVLSDESDLEPYIKAGYTTIDIEKQRSRAEKASSRYGQFLVPFAFGVAPLLQVFGTDNPMHPSSRAVQIPLFRFRGGERHIIDHIMVMLYPRADHRATGIGGPAAVTNGGTAMLVMRYFGYLGLHAVVDKRSNLGRDRLVDFTGELQVRLATDTREAGEKDKSRESFVSRLPNWHSRFIAEPAADGGRNRTDELNVKGSKGHKYAQELAPLPLQHSPSAVRVPVSSGKAGVSRGRLHGDDIEPFYHLSFCNELLFHPRLLHNCPKGNIVIKVELREVEWQPEFNGYFAHMPRTGPSIHNARRGPFLVHDAFTSCSPRGADHHFIDEFKVKLPLDLKPSDGDGGTRTLSLFFTVYNVRLDSKSTWRRAKKYLSTKSSESGDSDDQDAERTRLDQVACGFLPVSNHACMIDNGLHDVRVIYTARSPPRDFCDRGLVDPTTLILVERSDMESFVPDDSFAEENTVSSEASPLDRQQSGDAVNRTEGSVASLSDLASLAEDSQSRGGRTKGSATSEPISLSVRVLVHSSLHAQNETLASLLHEEPDLPRQLNLPSLTFMSKIKMGRDFLLGGSDLRSSKTNPEFEARLLELTIDVSKHQLCSVPQSSTHLMRIMPLLWRFLICGDGRPDLAWANPAASLPLRVHSFATILHLVGSSTMYLSKHGVTLVDGVSSWNVVAIGRVLALLFDEEKLFGTQAEELLNEELWVPSDKSDASSASGSPSDKRKRRHHKRQTYDLSNDLPARDELGGFDLLSPQAGALHSPPKSPLSPNRRHEPLDPNAKAPWVEELGLNLKNDQQLDNAAQTKVKLDSKSDFQSALRAAASEDDGDGFEADGSRAARAMIQAFGGMQGGSRRWMTAPSRALSTIRETEDADEPDFFGSEDDTLSSSSERRKEAGDDEMVLRNVKAKVKQFRRPKVGRDRDKPKPVPEDAVQEIKPKESPPQLVPKTDEEIETAGNAFLETIGKSLGVSTHRDSLAGEERRVGSSHHRKTHSRGTSIDWTLLSDDRGLDSHTSLSPIADDTPKSALKSGDNDESMSTLKAEENSCITLPNFVDRLSHMGKMGDSSKRWFPYAYEVIIMQWCAILISQRRAADKNAATATPRGQEAVEQNTVDSECLAHAAIRSVGVAVAAAPMLFEVIKQSLGFRISSLFHAAIPKNTNKVCPPLIKLDETLMLHLEQAVSMVTDACLDSRNFDSWELRQMSIDVNDSIIRFLRDLFGFLAPSCVHRLALVYLSRFVTKDGKQWQDRDSSIGLRCSWEITKLRINAVTALVRFPDFVRINGPQMMNWEGWMDNGPPLATMAFFDEIYDQYRKFRLTDLVGGDEIERRVDIKIPDMKPHWLSELVIDICLLGTVHAEQYIQHRSASLLHELFWSCSQYGVLKGRTGPIGSMFATFLEKLLPNVAYLSNFTPKSQLRKDLLPCAVFVLQAAPANLMRAVWRRLCLRVAGKGTQGKYSLLVDSKTHKLESGHPNVLKVPAENPEEPDILDVFSLLNLILKTMEYEGSEENAEQESAMDAGESIDLWRKEYLLSLRCDQTSDRRDRRKRAPTSSSAPNLEQYTSSISREWQAHDGSLVAINAAHQTVLEMYGILSTSSKGRSLLNPAVRSNRRPQRSDIGTETAISSNMAYSDVVLFLRGATSVYLQSLALRQSDIVIVRTFRVSAEALKIFGVKMFLEALGETLQHWLRVIFLNCGARRAHVRVEATDLLELVLRSTWECYGSFFRIRVPLLAVQTEVMERIVATAAARYYRDMRRQRTQLEKFSHLNAEASLVPLWRTLDRIEKQPASQNIAFRGALIRMAEKLKKLYRAYVAARVLSFIQGNRPGEEIDVSTQKSLESEALVRARRISVLRVVNASEGYSKQFLGFQGTSGQRKGNLAHYEAVEDALIDAADVFSPTELPEHRVAWLRMLADFHKMRKKHAEEATCHFYIHTTLHQASRLHGSLWSNTPFLPWTDNMPDPVYIDGDSPNADPDYESELDFDASDGNLGMQIESANSFRRIFYRVANSVMMGNDDWESGGAGKNLFCGATYPFEYYTVTPWITLREMEAQMTESAERAGELFLKAGIIQSSRFAWSLATQYYAEKFNYAKLVLSYGNLARTVVTQVPPIDTSLPQEVSATLGRFYRVWFHGGAPDELSGVEFVYRAQGDVRLDQFGEELREVIKSIIPERTPIHLLLDGRAEEKREESSVNYGFSRIGPAPLEPVRIKVTPLRPLSRTAAQTRGRPEWFVRYVEEAFSGQRHRSKAELNTRASNRRGGSSQIENASSTDPHHRDHARSFSATVFSSAGSSGLLATSRRGALSSTEAGDRIMRLSSSGESTLSGVDKFCFVQPKDRKRTSKEWWKVQSGDFAEKTLKVTQLQVAQHFPACVARQAVVHRLVYTQSPLEAGVDAVCQWCAVLFRTAVATVGQAVLGENAEPGIGTDAAKVVADCIHSSNVKEMGMALLVKNSDFAEGDSSTDFSLDYDRLTEDEIKKLRMKIARLIVVFIELLHLLIARNRDMLLDVIQERKKGVPDSHGLPHLPGHVRGTSTSLGDNASDRGHHYSTSLQGREIRGRESPYFTTLSLREGRGRETPTAEVRQVPATPTFETAQQRRNRSTSDAGSRNVAPHRRGRSSDDQSVISQSTRTDSAIAVQSELQRAFINLCRSLHPRIQGIMQDDTPRWLKQCSQDNYFSLGTYRLSKIQMAEELCFNASESLPNPDGGGPYAMGGVGVPSEIDSPPSVGGGGSSNHSVVSRGSERFGSRGSDRFGFLNS